MLSIQYEHSLGVIIPKILLLIRDFQENLAMFQSSEGTERFMFIKRLENIQKFVVERN